MAKRRFSCSSVPRFPQVKSGRRLPSMVIPGSVRPHSSRVGHRAEVLAGGHLSPARVQGFSEQGLNSWEGSQAPADVTEPVPKVLASASGMKMLSFILSVAAFTGLSRTHFFVLFCFFPS